MNSLTTKRLKNTGISFAQLSPIIYIMKPIIILLLTLMACKSIEKLTDLNKVKTPPGTIEVSKNLFVDQSEIGNVHYREFEYAITVQYGKESEEFISIQPDSGVWERQKDKFPKGNSYHYFRAPKYNSYPVVGISHSQAKAYASWRTDRVFQMMLIENKLIRTELTDFSFTVADYFEKRIPILKYDSTILIPYYSLPDLNAWESIISVVSVHQSDSSSYTTIETVSDELSYPLSLIRAEKYNKNGLYHLVGNAAEMTLEQGVAVGSSWNHKYPENLTKIYPYSRPEPWLGFRCVCRYIPFSEYKKMEPVKLPLPPK